MKAFWLAFLLFIAAPSAAQIHLDASGRVGIGAAPAPAGAKMLVSCTPAENCTASNPQALLGRSSGGVTAVGVEGHAEAPGVALIGVRGAALEGTYAYGVRGDAGGSSSASYGVYGWVPGRDGSSFAGYFSGDVYTSGFNAPSDGKLKEEVRPLTGSLGKLLQLRPRAYRYRRSAEYARMNLPSGDL